MPSLSSGGPSVTPGVSSRQDERGDAVARPCRRRSSANSTQTSATGPLVIKFLVPVSTQPSPSRTAARPLRRRVGAGLGLGQREAAELLAARERAASACFCASVPNGQDRIADQRVVHGHDDAGRRAGARDLLHRERVADGVHAGAAPAARGPRCPGSRARPSARRARSGGGARDRSRRPCGSDLACVAKSRAVSLDQRLLGRSARSPCACLSNATRRVQVGGRFARKAAMPSLWSAVANSAANAARSSSSAASSGSVGCRRATSRLAAATASGALAAIVAADARARAAAARPARARALTRPMRSASSASMIVAGEDQLAGAARRRRGAPAAACRRSRDDAEARPRAGRTSRCATRR